jgi:cellobiose phosphorylase
MIIESFIPGTALVPFGGGDWNDSLQPVSKELAQKMISSWTVEMNYQAFIQLQQVYELSGNTEKAKELKDICHRIKSDFNKHLIKNEVVGGYGIVESNNDISLLLHPNDTKTNISYSVLPMNRGIISGIFSMEQADAHQNLVEKHLKGPDGVRLMDRPIKYKGGVQEIFQRAESSTYFGREIGLMYVHEHIRYAESLAIMGKGEAFIKALRQAIPVGYSSIVPCGDIRQSNCYYSSSDVVFKSRYDADKRYEEVKKGNITLRGGWRVYSSAPGIFIGLIISRLIGLRVEFDRIVIDPVMPKSFDGFASQIKFLGKDLKLTYIIKGEGFSPNSIVINGKEIRFALVENQYRRGGAIISKDVFLDLLNKAANEIEINI